MVRRLALAFLTCATALAARAHDFWIEPSTFRPAVGQMFTVRLRVGQNFDGDPLPRSAQLIESFAVYEVSGPRAINGFENQDPAGYVRLFRPGSAIIGYRSTPYPLELSAEKFNEFLQQEGLDEIRKLRRQRGEDAKPDRERFTRYAKAIVGESEVGGRGAEVLGYRLEIIPDHDLFRVLFEGKPLAGALVKALQRDDPNARLALRTDSAGRVTFPLSKGVWLIECVAVVPAPAGSGVDWESLWASLTFER